MQARKGLRPPQRFFNPEEVSRCCFRCVSCNRYGILAVTGILADIVVLDGFNILGAFALLAATVTFAAAAAVLAVAFCGAFVVPWRGLFLSVLGF